MRIFIVAGEASGDLHASHLVRELRAHLPDAEFIAWGGAHLASTGAHLKEDLVENSVMGFVPVLLSLGGLLGTVARFEEELRQTPPDLLIIVDYPGLNLNLARLAKRHGVPVVSYICPQVWAWAPWRIRKVARRSDLLLLILPFEEEIYRRVHKRAHFVGNPVFDHLARLDADDSLERIKTSADFHPEGKPCLALFPGSRRQEIRETLGAQCRVAEKLLNEEDYHVVVSCQRHALLPAIEEKVLAAAIPVEVYTGPARDLQVASDLSLVCSGTATLEQAWYGTPMVVMYAASEVERALYRNFSVAPYFALVNLFAGRKVVPEVLFTPGDEEAVTRNARQLIRGEQRERVMQDLRLLKEDRFEPGAAVRGAEEIARFILQR